MTNPSITCHRCSAVMSEMSPPPVRYHSRSWNGWSVVLIDMLCDEGTTLPGRTLSPKYLCPNCYLDFVNFMGTNRNRPSSDTGVEQNPTV